MARILSSERGRMHTGAGSLLRGQLLVDEVATSVVIRNRLGLDANKLAAVPDSLGIQCAGLRHATGLLLREVIEDKIRHKYVCIARSCR